MNDHFRVAIDPGTNGGFALQLGERPVFALPMPKSEIEVVELISGLVHKAGEEHARLDVILEKVGGFVKKKGSLGQPGSAMFRFGRGVGVIAGTLMAYLVPFKEVTPQEWQQTAGTGTVNGRTSGEWKRHLRNLASQRYPHLKPTLNTADALLMLESFKT